PTRCRTPALRRSSRITSALCFRCPRSTRIRGSLTEDRPAPIGCKQMTAGDSLGFLVVATTVNTRKTPVERRLRLRVALSALLAGVLLTGCAQVNAGITRLPAVELGEASFYPTLQAYAGTPIINGNEVQVLLNGEQIFPALTAAIRSARKSITYAQYF